MTVLGSLARQPRNVVQATPWGDWGDGTSTAAGVNVRVDNATQLLTVYGCTRFIADGISTLPIDVFSDPGSGPVEVTKPRWLVEPAPGLDFVGWCGQVLTSLLLAGNAYCQYGYSGPTLTSLAPINPAKVEVRRERGRKMFRVDGRDYSTFEILHIPGLMWPGDDVGMSPVEAAKQMIAMGMAMEEFGGKFFDQGATLSGVIETPTELNPTQARDMARAWGRRHSGKNKSHLPGVLTGGATWKSMGVTNEQSQFLESRKFTASQIAADMFLIDPNEMGLPVDGTSLTYSNQEQRNTRKVQVTFLPWLIRVENAISALLAKPRYMKFNVEGLLRGDTKSRWETYEIASRINTAAALLGQPPVLTTPEMRDFEDFGPTTPGGE